MFSTSGAISSVYFKIVFYDELLKAEIFHVVVYIKFCIKLSYSREAFHSTLESMQGPLTRFVILSSPIFEIVEPLSEAITVINVAIWCPITVFPLPIILKVLHNKIYLILIQRCQIYYEVDV